MNKFLKNIIYKCIQEEIEKPNWLRCIFLEETNLQTPEPNSQKTLYLLKKLNFCLNILSKENHMVCHKSRKGNKRAYR